MKRILFAAAVGCASSACAATPPPDTAIITTPSFVEAVRSTPPGAQSAPEPPAVMLAKADTPTLRGRTAAKSKRAAAPETPQQRLAAANRSARQGPAAATFEDATLVYGYEPGALYELHTTPAFISTIRLETGETLVDVAAGDTTGWMVSNTVVGTGDDARTLVMVKPQAVGLKTNIVLVTNRRAYLIEAVSAAGDGYAAQVAWRYPAPPAPPVVEIPDPPPRAINDGYRIKPPRKAGVTVAPPWTPVRVFDDGLKTWIEFPGDIAASDMPPLFVRTGEGAELVNYRVQRNRYIVDRVFDVAELRLGRVDPVVVRIERRRPSNAGKASS